MASLRQEEGNTIQGRKSSFKPVQCRGIGPVPRARAVKAANSLSVRYSRSPYCLGRVRGTAIRWLMGQMPCRSGSPQGVLGGVHGLAPGAWPRPKVARNSNKNKQFRKALHDTLGFSRIQPAHLICHREQVQSSNDCSRHMGDNSPRDANSRRRAQDHRPER